MSENIDVEGTPKTYREFVAECLPKKKEEGVNPQNAMAACALDWRAHKDGLSGQEVAEGEDELKGQLYLVGGEDCPSCDDAKEHFKEDLEKGTIQLVTIDDDKGWSIIKTLELAEVPTLVLEKEDGSFCKVGEDGKVEACLIPKAAESE